MNRQNENMMNLKPLCDKLIAGSRIEPQLYDRFHVKRGLRRSDGTGVIAGITKICNVHGYVVNEGEIDPIPGELIYRGYQINDLISHTEQENRFGFEETVYLLLLGELPNRQELDAFTRHLSACRPLPDNFVVDMILKAPSNNIMNKMARSVLALYSYDPECESRSIENELRTAIRLIAKNLRGAVANEAEGREGMALGQFVTGMAFSNVGLGIAHSVAHTLGAVYDTPHGVACAMMLPIVMEYNADVTGEKYKAIAEAMGVDTAGMDQETYRKAAVDAVRQLSVDVGIPTKLAAIKEEDLEFLAQSAAADACAPGNPKAASVEDIKGLIRKLM